MYLKLPDYTKLVIKNLYTVWLPPIPRDRHLIQGWELKRKDQRWHRHDLPEYYKERREEEAYNQGLEEALVISGDLKKIQHFDPVLEQYRRDQWSKRIHGMWVMINGTPTYICPSHWMYLQWSKFDHPENDGYPIYYSSQLGRFYFRQLCAEDPFCLGYIFIGPRGYGKTSEEVAVIMDDITKPPHNRHVAIQSKSEDDAIEVVFQEKMVPLFNAYPDFFKPKYAHGSNPKQRMSFKRKTSSKADQSKVKFGPDQELGNTIKAFSAKEKAVDGKTAASVYSTEIGKTNPREEANVYKRHGVHVKVVYRNNVKRGLIREESTVEEMEEGGDECYEIWRESDPSPSARDANGYTKSKIYRFFVDGIDAGTKYADDYGNIDEDKARTDIMNERAPFEDQPEKLSLVTRKNPLTEEEAFMKDQSKCMFNTFILTKRIGELKELKRLGQLPGRRGFVEWVSGKVDSDVEWIDNPTGNVVSYFMPDAFRGDRKILNACKFEMNPNGSGQKLWLPVNSDLYRGAADPIKFVETNDPRASRLAAGGYQMFDPKLDLNKEDMMTWISDNLMWEYCERHEDPEEDYENVIKCLRYFGHHFMPEGNVSDFTKHLYGRGYQKFMIVRRDFDPSVLMQKSSKNALGQSGPVHTGTEVIDSFVKFIKKNINKKGMRNPSLELLQQCYDFDPSPRLRTKYDRVIFWGYCLMALEADLEDYTQNLEENMGNPWPRFNNGGSRSILLPDNYRAQGDEEEYNMFDDPKFINDILNRQV